MEAGIRTTLAAIRRKRGLSAAHLARAAGLSRQTLYAIEAGTYLPNTVVALRLARVLEVGVEDLFSLAHSTAAERPATARATALPDGPELRTGQPVELCRVGRRLVASAPFALGTMLPPADAAVLHAPVRDGAVQVRLFREEGTPAPRLLVAGCDPGISVLARHVARAGVELVAAHRNSSQSLALLEKGLIHVAGSHLREEASGESNLPTVRRMFPTGSVAVFTFAVWEEGLLVARGNPKSIRGIEDLSRSDVSIVNREAGAGSRQLLDARLSQLGIPAERVRGYDHTAPGHLQAAWQVASGEADCCLATGAAARWLGLDFLPLMAERYDFVLRRAHLHSRPVELLIETLNRAAFRRELEGMGGYDATAAGTRLL